MSTQFSNSQSTTITTSAAETTIVTADPNTENLLTGLVISSTTAQIAVLTLRDSTGAAVAKAVIDFPSAAAIPAAPLWLEFCPPLKQSTKNTNWTLQSNNAAASFKVVATFITEE